jgi:C-5 cytosine-specific DNA methylase
MTAPLGIDLFCGLGGWTDGLLAEGYHVIGFDIEQHIYGEHRYAGNLVIQDVLTIDGARFRNASLIVASPPCQGYSYRAMPWKRARALPPPDNALFDACFRIQREASEAAGRHVPMIVENVRGAQPWVGRARWNYGSFYLWGDVPALMPTVFRRAGSKSNDQIHIRAGHTHTKRMTNPLEHAIKQGGDWFAEARRGGAGGTSASYGSKSPQRKAASALIAKIPLPLSRYIAATFHPRVEAGATNYSQCWQEIAGEQKRVEP